MTTVCLDSSLFQTHSPISSQLAFESSRSLAIMQGSLSLSFFALSLSAAVSFAEHIKPQNILWGERGPAAATLLPSTKTSLSPNAIEERDTVCTNTPERRDCWAGGYSVSADFDKKWPTTDTKTVHVRLFHFLFPDQIPPLVLQWLTTIFSV